MKQTPTHIIQKGNHLHPRLFVGAAIKYFPVRVGGAALGLTERYGNAASGIG